MLPPFAGEVARLDAGQQRLKAVRNSGTTVTAKSSYPVLIIGAVGKERRSIL